ncbi:MAG: double-strand break repair protein AddB, partial [Nitratireductor sp.]
MGSASNTIDGKENWLAGGQPANNVYSIAPSLPFLQTLAKALVSGQLISGFNPSKDPLCLADATIYLPTRRAARGFNLELLKAVKEQTGREVALLPRIFTIGDLDEDEMILGFESDVPLDAFNKINTDERRLILARLVRKWTELLRPESKALFENEDIVLPSSAADAIRLASSVASFMDRVETEEVDWQDVKNIEVDAQAQWGQITASFLDIVMEQWPEVLKARDKINPAQFRTKLMDARIAQLQERAKKGPLIVAGSTGSIPATSRLIASISTLENGAIVLPGVDHDLLPDIALQLASHEELSNENVLSTHPQFGLGRLLGLLNCKQADVQTLGHEHLEDDLATREKLINLSLLPPNHTDQWQSLLKPYESAQVEAAFKDVTYVEAASERQEALAIALIMREALAENDTQSAALITPDRNLARRVGSELKRYNINIDDSGGAPLLLSIEANFLKLIAKCFFEDPDPVSYASLLKNKYLRVGLPAHKARNLAELIELLFIRDAGIVPKLGTFEHACKQKLATLEDTKYAPRILKNMSEETKADVLDFCHKIDVSFAPIASLLTDHDNLALNHLLDALSAVANKLAITEDAKIQLFDNSAGAALKSLLGEYSNIDCSGFEISSNDVVPVFEALMFEKRFTNPENSHPRLHIYGPLEARLQTSDVVILGGLNEGTWPQVSGNDPFLNRPMSSQLGIPLPERRIGLSAHDFQQMSGNRKLFYTRSQRVDNAPTIESRWLQRLNTLIGAEHSKTIKARGNSTLQLTQLIDKPEKEIVLATPPRPTPPAAARPKSLSITEIETWLRDPYAIYAKHVLGLYGLQKLVRDTDAAMKGNLYHAIAEEFTRQWDGEIVPAAYDKINEIADAEFEKVELPDEIKSVWRMRFDTIGKKLVEWQKNKQHKIRATFVEVSAKHKIHDVDFTLRGRADRIDVMHDGTLSIIDYKTGSAPSILEAKALSPQLGLTGALAFREAFSTDE